MTTILFAHGAGATPDDPPRPALQNLLGPGYDIIAPDLGPPDAARWSDILKPLLSAISPRPILIGHSLGGSHILKCLAELGPAAQPRAFVGLACPFWGAKGWESDAFALPVWAPDALVRVPIRMFHATDDDVVPVSHLDAWQDRLPNARCHRLVTGGHLFDTDLSAIALTIAEL